MQTHIQVLRVTRWRGVQCLLCHQDRTDSLCCFNPQLLKHLTWTLLTCFALMPTTQCRSQGLLLQLVSSARAKNEAPAFCHFSLKRNKVFVPVMHVISQISLKCSPSYLRAVPCCLSKKHPPGKALLKILSAITLDSRECKCKRSGNRKPLVGEKNTSEKNEYSKTEELILFKRNLSVYYLSILPPKFAPISNIRGEWLSLFAWAY